MTDWRRALAFLAMAALLPGADRYAELVRVIDWNTGFAHATRGVNMYTLYALRSCVTVSDVPVLTRVMSGKDQVARMAAADVLADLGPAGQEAILRKLKAMLDIRMRGVLQEALDDAQKPDYRPILQYPMSASEMAGIRGCK